MRTPFVSIGLVLIIAASTACGRSRDATHSPPSQPVQTTSGSASKAPAIPDQEISSAVQRALRRSFANGSQKVDVSTDAGIVTLTGTVGDIAAKGRAVAAAETIKGARSIVNLVNVVPAKRSDAQIGADVLSSLHRDPATRNMNIAIAVSKGVVTATGTVDSFLAENIVAEDIEAVPGVTQLENDLTVKVVVLRPTAEILAQVERRLANDVWLDGSSLDTSMVNRTMKLRGVVGSLAAKERARTDASVLGVESVDDSGLIIDWWAQNAMRRTNALAQRSDADVKRAVIDAFTDDPRLARIAPEVTVKNGTVTLTGAADSPRARRAAESDAKNTIGVWDVVDEAVVSSTATRTDADIERSARRAIKDDPFSGDTRTSVTLHAQNGKITLTGTVPGASSRLDVDTDVASVPGVKAIEDDLTVKAPPPDLTAEIMTTLFWDPRLDIGDVHVAVDPNGLATLTGNVFSIGEATAATEDALASGAAHVDNRLSVKGRNALSSGGR